MMSIVEVRSGGTSVTLRKNLILHHRVPDILNHAAKLIHILSVGQKLRDFVLLCQRNEVFENVVQFATECWVSD